MAAPRQTLSSSRRTPHPAGGTARSCLKASASYTPRVARAREIAALALVVVAAATPLPQAGWNAAAHFSLVESLADGTPRIDEHLNQSGDIAWVDGHFYAAKSPGLAAFSLPLYVTLDAADSFPPKQEASSGLPGAQAVPERSIWRINLVVLGFFFVLLLLVRRVVDGVYPGTGVVVALILGLGTMLLPFAAAYFSHVPSATLAFASFALVQGERGLDPWRLVAAGTLAGLAVFTDLPLAVVAACLSVYVVANRLRPRRAALYGAGLLAGLAPLVAYNAWAFGSPLRNGYSNAVAELGETGHDVIGANDQGFFGLTHPRAGVLVDLLFSERGLFVLMPVTLVAVGGLVLLARRGRRREALFIGGLAAAILLYNASYYLPFGGGSPGPRFLVPLLPFLALPLAAALRSWPLVTLAAAAVSAFWMISATVAGPLLAEDTSPSSWIGDIVREHELANSVLANGRISLVILLVPALLGVGLVVPNLLPLFKEKRLLSRPPLAGADAQRADSQTEAQR
jgi:hypothetical protein